MGKDVHQLDELRETVRALMEKYPAPNQLAIVYHPCDRVKVDANEELTKMLEELNLLLYEWEGAVPGELEVVVASKLPRGAERQPRWREAPVT